MKNNIIYDYLLELFPNPKCELNYNKDYELLISTMLSAQSTDKTVNKVTDILFKKYNTLEQLKNAKIEDIKNIIRPVGSYNKKSSYLLDIANKVYEIGFVPNDRTFLESLSGVGRKTTNVVLSEIFNLPFVAIDTHVNRVSKRLGIALQDDNLLTVENKIYLFFKEEQLKLIHICLVLFGRYHCKSIKPKCNECKLKNICNYYQDITQK